MGSARRVRISARVCGIRRFASGRRMRGRGAKRNVRGPHPPLTGHLPQRGRLLGTMMAVDRRHELQVSKHGAKRVRQRVGLPKRAVERNAQRALVEGIGYREASGALKRYISWLYERYYGNGNNIRIYGDKVWVFHDGILITVLNVPGEHRKAAVSAKAKRRAEPASAAKQDAGETRGQANGAARGAVRQQRKVRSD